VRLVGISLNTAKLDPDARARILQETEHSMSVACFDPMKTSLDAAVDGILSG
jgi:uncharacterized NAD-dependent epimerase/dehydratase family protein